MKFWKRGKKEDDDKVYRLLKTGNIADKTVYTSTREAVAFATQWRNDVDVDKAAELIDKGLELSSLGRYDESEQYFYQAVEIDPNLTAIWYGIADPDSLDGILSGFSDENEQEQLERYDKVLRIHPRNTRALIWKGVKLDEIGKHDEALSCYRKALDYNSRALWILVNKARVAFNDHESAIRTLETVLELSPQHLRALYMMARALSGIGKHEHALSFYDKMLKLEPNNASILTDKGMTLDNMGKCDEALVCFDMALTLEPNHVTALTNKGVVLDELGRQDEALVSYDKALNIDSIYFNALYNKSRLRAKQGMYDESLDLLEQAIKSNATCKERARRSTEYSSLRKDPRFKKLVE